MNGVCNVRSLPVASLGYHDFRDVADVCVPALFVVSVFFLRTRSGEEVS